MSRTGETSSVSNSYEWIVTGDQLGLKSETDECSVSAIEIIHVEFEDLKTVNNIEVTSKPSNQFRDLKLNRFPAKLELELEMPVTKKSKPLLKALLSSGDWKCYIESLPKSDHLIVGNQWFSIEKYKIGDIDKILQRVKIDRFGVISLSQALELILLETDDLTVTESKVVEVADGEYLNVNSDIDFSNTGFKATLYPYQQTGVSWLESITNEGLGSVLADEMGLGKTVQIIALLSIFKKKWRLPSLIITRATIIENWRREFDKFSDGLSVRVHMGVKRSGLPSKIKKFDVTLTSYETAVRDQLMFALIEWGFVVLDEAQDIKNPWTNRAIAVKSFKRRISIAVTGTPVENKLLDLWSIMDFTHSGLLGAKNHFEENFVNNESSARQIERIVSPFMLRRLISEVADDLPEKIIIPQAIEMSEIEIELYEVLRQEIVAEYGTVAELVSMIKLRQFCAHPLILEECKELNHLLESNKYLRMIEILEEIFEMKQKGIIFTSFIKMSDLLTEDIGQRFKVPCEQIDGRTPIKGRQKIVDLFSDYSEPAILILNPRAAGAGINITAANHVIHYNLEWNPAVEDQATARSHRLGQSLPVTVHRFFYTNTIEEVMNERIERKRNIADTAVIGTSTPGTDSADIARALKISPAHGLLQERMMK